MYHIRRGSMHEKLMWIHLVYGKYGILDLGGVPLRLWLR